MTMKGILLTGLLLLIYSFAVTPLALFFRYIIKFSYLRNSSHSIDKSNWHSASISSQNKYNYLRLVKQDGNGLNMERRKQIMRDFRELSRKQNKPVLCFIMRLILPLSLLAVQQEDADVSTTMYVMF